MEAPIGHPLATSLQKRSRLVIILALVLTAGLAIPFLALAPDQSASMEPGGEVFEARDAIDDRFVSSVYDIHVITEARHGDMLAKEALLELQANADALRSDPDLAPTLFGYFDASTGRDVFGVTTFADLVDEQLPGGLATSDQAAIDTVAAGLIEAFGADADELGLSAKTSFDENASRWVSPAVISTVLADNEALGFGNVSVTLGTDTEPEEYARDVLEVIRGEERAIESWGIAIDVNLTSQEQGRLAGPFIGFTILGVLLVVGITFRSYWVVAITGAALSSLMLWLKGISNLIGLDDSLILSLIVPIAMISFGVDFAFHAVGRYREERRLGLSPPRALVVGAAGVAGALVLALASDAAAFLSNVPSGIDAIVQFGVGAAIALTSAFLLLGVVTPLAVAMVEDEVGAPPPAPHRTLHRVAASSLAALATMGTVLVMVYVLPWAGVAALAVYLVAFLLVPYMRAGRYPAQDGESGQSRTGPVTRAVGAVISRVARARRWVLPVAAVLTVAAALVAVQISAEFEVEDFFTHDSDFVVSLDKVGEHIGDRGGEETTIYVVAPLDDPEVLATMAEFADEIRDLDTPLLARDQEGVRIRAGVLDVLAEVQESEAAQGAIAQATGVTLTDGDGNGIPDTTEQLAAVYGFTRQAGVPFDTTRLVLTPNDVRTSVWVSDNRSTHATVLSLGLIGTGSQQAVNDARDALNPLLDDLRAELRDIDADAEVVLTGGPIVRQAELDGITRALQVSLPISVVLCLVIAWIFMRSLRLAAVCTVPILMTVAWLYALMYLLGYSINMVTATIGAVSIGVGIDFAIHFTMRYREEIDGTASTIEAVRRAGEGTGMALVASAASSAVGFGILAFAPMPLFASYGLLTALMIIMALAASLLVLPALLVMVTPSPEPDAEHTPQPVMVRA